MSAQPTPAELAREEAERVEAEERERLEAIDGGDGDEPEPEETPAPPAPGAGPTEAQLKAFEKENTRHEKRLRDIMGADFEEFGLCVACEGVGFAPQPQVQPHDKYKTCPTCAGHGVVLTGSRAQGSEVQPCPGCGGRGYLERLEPPAHRETERAGDEPEPAYGVPTWMGDPNLSGQQH